MMKPFTTETVRKYASEHFDMLRQYPSLQTVNGEGGQLEPDLGMALFEAVLALEVDELFDVSDWCMARNLSEQHLKAALGTMPFVAHSCQLLRMEFVHDAVGAVPMDVVRTLISSEEPVPYEGAQLTKDTVSIQYRRRPL